MIDNINRSECLRWSCERVRIARSGAYLTWGPSKILRDAGENFLDRVYGHLCKWQDELI